MLLLFFGSILEGWKVGDQVKMMIYWWYVHLLLDQVSGEFSLHHKRKDAEEAGRKISR